MIYFFKSTLFLHNFIFIWLFIQFLFQKNPAISGQFSWDSKLWWINIFITIYFGPLLHFTSIFFIAFHILFYYILRITIYVNFITFYVSYYILHQKVITFCVSVTFYVIIAIFGSKEKAIWNFKQQVHQPRVRELCIKSKLVS